MKLDVLRSAFVVALLGVFTVAGLASGSEQASDAPDPKPAVKEGAVVDASTPVAVVNGKPISKGEFDRAMEGYLQQFRRMSGNMHGKVAEPNAQMRSDVLQQLVDRELLYQESLKDPAPNPEELVDKEFENLRSRFPNEEAMNQALAAQGLDQEQLRDLMGRQVQVRHYLEKEVLPTVEVSDEEVRDFYEKNEDKFATPEQVRCSHILIRTPPEATEEQRKEAYEKAKGLQVRCAEGESFAELAKEFSEDPGSAEQGGDLGFFTRERMVTPFSDAAFALDIGEVSDVVETRFGYHVIKLAERKEASQQEFDAVKENIQNYLQTQALDAAVKQKVATLRESAEINVMAPHL